MRAWFSRRGEESRPPGTMISFRARGRGAGNGSTWTCRGSAEGRTIVKEAYIYGFSVVDNLRVQHAYFVDRQNRCASGSTLALGEPIAFAVHFENVDMMS